MAGHAMKGIAFAAVYAEDYGRALHFYEDVLGIEKQFDMGDQACFFSLPDDTGLYLQGGCRRAEYAADTMRAAFVFLVESASATHERLAAHATRFVHAEPVDMGGGSHWFQFYDPDGNLLEIVGGE